MSNNGSLLSDEQPLTISAGMLFTLKYIYRLFCPSCLVFPVLEVAKNQKSFQYHSEDFGLNSELIIVASSYKWKWGVFYYKYHSSHHSYL